MSTLEVNKITPVSGGTTVQVGESGDTINIPAGATIANAGTATGFGVSLANGADNRVVTASSASALNGEANLTYNGTILGVGGTGDLGVGVHIKTGDSGASVDGNADELVVEGSGQSGITVASGSSDKGNIFFADSGGTAQGKIIYDHSSDLLRFDTAGSERIRFKNNGDININKTVNDRDTDGVTIYADDGFAITKDAGNILYLNRRSSNGSIVEFSKNGSAKGSIHVGDSSVTYNTSSDYRLKENETAISDGITRLKTLKPYRFNFKEYPDTTVDGFFAHEVFSVVPEAISGEKDGAEMQGIDQSKLVPLLTAALKEAITKIETLETEMTSLKARVQTLESA
jgi:hypothetical protein